MENKARKEYIECTGNKVVECGIVVHYVQHWLLASPNGMIITSSGSLKILVLKSLYSCKNKPIVDSNGTINVSCIENLNSGKCNLKKSHEFYIECQILMYCTGAKECDFFIYTPKFESVLLTIQRDEDFLNVYIPKVEKFYFNYLLSNLIKKYGL